MDLKPEVRKRRVPPTRFWLRLAAASFVIKLVLVAFVFWLVHTAARAAMDDEKRAEEAAEQAQKNRAGSQDAPAPPPDAPGKK